MVWKILFYTANGEFNWGAVTALIAIGTLIWTIWFNAKKYKADLISKSRIQWMSETRPLIADYLVAVSKYLYLYDIHVTEKKDNQSELTETMENIRGKYYLLKVYGIVNNKTDLSRDIQLLWYELEYIVQYYNYGRDHGKFINAVDRSNYETVVDEYLSGLIMQATEEAQRYFDDTWDKVKRGK